MMQEVSVTWKKNGQDVVNSSAISFSGEARLINPETFEDTLVFNSFLIEEEGNYSCDSRLSINSLQLQAPASSMAYYIVAAEGV